MHQKGKLSLAALTGATAGPVTVALANATSPLLALGLLGGGIFGLAMLVFPFAGFLVTVFSVPLERIGRFTNDSSAYTFSLIRALGLVNTAAIVLHCCLFRKRIRGNLPMALYAAYVGIALITMVNSPDWIGSVRAASATLGNLLFFFVVINLVHTKQQVRIVLGCWLLVTVGVGLFTIYGWHRGAVIVDDRFRSTGERSTDERFAMVLEDAAEVDVGVRVPRAMGPTSHPAVYAINTIMTIPFFAFFFRRTQSWPLRCLIALGAGVAAYNVLLTNTRAAVLTLLLMAGFVCLLRVLRPSLALIVAAVVAGVAILPFLPAALYDRVFKTENYSAAKSATLSARFMYWEAAIEVFGEHPFFGVGLGNQTEIPKKMTKIAMPPNSTAHNEYLNSLIEVGLFGYAVLVAFFVVLYRRCSTAQRVFERSGDGDTALLMRAIRAMFLGVLVYAVQVDCFHFPLKGWWLAVGLGMVLYAVAMKEQGRRTDDTVANAA